MKKIISGICSVLIVVILSYVFVGCGNNYTYQEGDFSLEISVDKAMASVDEPVTVTVVFKNLSEKNIRIQMTTPLHKTLKSAISISISPESLDIGNRIEMPSVGGVRKKTTLKKNTVIQVTTSFTIPLSDDSISESFKIIEPHDVFAHIGFYVGSGYKEFVGLYSETIKVSVEE